MDEIYEKYWKLLVADARNRMIDVSLAEDCAQETMIIYLTKIKEGAVFNDEKALFSFLIKTNENNALHINRCEAKECVLGESRFADTTDVPIIDNILREEECDKLDAALHTIPFHHAVATICRYGYGMTYEEIARKVGNSKESARKYSRRGIDELKEKFKE